MSKHEQAWKSMSKNAKSADFSRFNIEIPYFGPPHAYLTSWDPLCHKKEKMSTHEQAWVSMCKHEQEC